MPRETRSKPATMHRAGELRRDPTPAEAKLWACLRGNQLGGVSFRRQHAIGNYIADFCSVKAKMIIELDGSPHLEQEEHDSERSNFLKSKGYTVFRFWNKDIIDDINGVLRVIRAHIENKIT